ncbi:TPA: host cell division inhibitor Icd-like protein [Escherichia coli]|nr:host cell division inhibitor Icd-like protein [Escherichia coli]HBB9112823.1 host cell division inhibitor Icd-like protein [Escherichia coli]
MATIPTPTHSEFIWRFYSCQKHLYICVMAVTEAEARSYLPLAERGVIGDKQILGIRGTT